MILPTKHITLNFSLLNCGAVILSILKPFDTVSSLRERTRNLEILSNYEKFIITLDFLFMIGAINLDHGQIVRCVNA
jgi:hypothetical protein